jgi:ribonuclease R
MAEVEIISLVSRSHDPLLTRIISKKWKQFLKIIPEQGNLEVPFFAKDTQYTENSIISVRFGANDQVEVVWVFGREDDIDLDERLILWLSRARTEFPGSVIWESEEVRQYATKTDLKNRTDFRDWYTLTIDGSDAKDLDDAISIRQEQNGDYTLAVHIADVAEYVTEGSSLDREALTRATSIYTPGKVIPMLPEILSNDLCSLHPGTMKLTLSAVMTIDAKWYVKHTDIVEGIIESQHRGVYDDIYAMMGDESMEELGKSIKIATTLYHLLEKRRRKEGKITFESTEVYFDFGDEVKNWIQKTPVNIKRRERNDAHKLIEEFMVLANEEVAKWCKKHDLPFLSRVHGLPGNEQTEIINTILAQTQNNQRLIKLPTVKWTRILEPTHIREFLENISDPTELYRYSRLLLPKMAKATYSDTPFRHFGLALEYYSHFTSPIRRYPDLQVHRIIKEQIRGELTPERISHYKALLKRVARNCSERERWAEDIERAMNSLYICRYMADKVGKTYDGQISGLAEFALFVELENGIEATLYLPRGRYHIDSVNWVLSTPAGKQLGTIGERIRVKVESVNMVERRVVVEKI